jgi:SAM-dependent methyltransferase
MMKLRRLALSFRKSLPDRARRALRIARHVLAARQPSSANLPEALIPACRMCASRYQLIGMLPGGGHVAEIGTDRGHFAQHILARSNPSRLHLIDLDFSLLEPAVAKDARVKLHRGDSREIVASFQDAYFDWVYIDADHSYEGVMRDASSAASKVKLGGFLVFNDFAHVDPLLGSYGVHRAVVDFAIERKWTFAFFAYDPQALYDVALQRPHDSG